MDRYTSEELTSREAFIILGWYYGKKVNPFVRARLAQVGMDRHDIFQASFLHAISYPPKKSVKLTTSMPGAMRWAISRIFNKLATAKRSAAEPVSLTEAHNYSYSVSTEVFDYELDSLIDSLDPEHRLVIIHRFGLRGETEKTFPEISEYLGKGRTTALNRYESAMAILREHFTSEI